ncbi:hypothetical protein ACQP2Y_21105 [Actinoplanes sp. CA-051413]|uniref:hypothetical protein n=1 Tax=Actinoplanes sp. CA-051413 TaxID=3239899 RepID=UPI003D971DBA
MSNVKVETACLVESDGYHAHEYRICFGIWYHASITEHLHSWNAEHQANWPDSKLVDAWRGQQFLSAHDALADAWAEYGDGDIPAVNCKLP